MVWTIARLLRPIDVRRHNRATIARVLASRARRADVVYDIGCGDRPFAPDIRALGCVYIGVDIAEGFYKERPDLIGAATAVPAPDNVADIVISSQVLEHLEEPVEALKEAHRLLKPGGVLICSFPFLYPIHAAPHDYGRYTRFFIAGAAERLGYEILSEASYSGFWRVAGMAFALYAQGFQRRPLTYTGIIPIITAIQQWLCVAMHNIERLAARVSRRDANAAHRSWPLNYVFVLGKRAASADGA